MIHILRIAPRCVGGNASCGAWFTIIDHHQRDEITQASRSSARGLSTSQGIWPSTDM